MQCERQWLSLSSCISLIRWCVYVYVYSMQQDHRIVISTYRGENSEDRYHDNTVRYYTTFNIEGHTRWAPLLIFFADECIWLQIKISCIISTWLQGSYSMRSRAIVQLTVVRWFYNKNAHIEPPPPPLEPLSGTWLNKRSITFVAPYGGLDDVHVFGARTNTEKIRSRGEICLETRSPMRERRLRGILSWRGTSNR